MYFKFKKILLENKFIYFFNRATERRKVKKNYNKIVQKYAKLDQHQSINDLLNNNGFNETWCSKFNNRLMNVLFIGTDEKQDKSGFVQSLSKYCNLYSFHNEDGTWGHFRDGNGQFKNGMQLVNLLENYKNSGNEIDLIIMQCMGKSFCAKELNRIKRNYHLKIINIGMDERLAYYLPTKFGLSQNNGISGLNDCIDLCLTTCPEVVDWYLKEGVPAIYFPLASSQDFYFPIENKKLYDIGFIGSKYGSRAEIISFLIDNGINVTCYGPGWDNGLLDISKNNQFYNECKIVLGFGGIGYCEDFTNPKLRDFEVPLSKSFYITTKTKELDGLFNDGENIVLYNDRYELLSLIRFYLDNEKKRNLIANSSYEIAADKHTFDKRFEVLFDGLLTLNFSSNMFYK